MAHTSMVTKGQLIKVGVCENEQVHAICIRCHRRENIQANMRKNITIKRMAYSEEAY